MAFSYVWTIASNIPALKSDTCKNYAEERSLTKRSRFNVIIAICQEGHYIAAVTRTGVIHTILSPPVQCADVPGVYWGVSVRVGGGGRVGIHKGWAVVYQLITS